MMVDRKLPPRRPATRGLMHRHPFIHFRAIRVIARVFLLVSLAALSGCGANLDPPSVGHGRRAVTSGARKTADVLWYTLPEGNASVQLSTGSSFGVQGNWITGFGVP